MSNRRPMLWSVVLCLIALAIIPSVATAEDAKMDEKAAMDEKATMEEKSLYDRLGGLMPISVVVNDFIDVLVVDETLNANPNVDAARKRVPAAYLKYQVTALVCQVTGGSCDYKGRAMQETHAHLKITQKEWDRMVVLFKQVLAKHKVPEKETMELLDIVGSTKKDIVVAS